MTYEEYIKKQKEKIKNNYNATVFARDSYAKPLISNEELLKPSGYEAYKSQYAFNPNLDTSQGLYQVAQMSGLGSDARRVVERVGGESDKFFSGGFVSDTLDLLNMLQYGVVGMLKGDGFVNGIKERASMSDEDALGQYGFAGKVAGFALDILLDPLTYIAPYKVVTRIPGAVKLFDKASTKAFGKVSRVSIDGQKFKIEREGGWSPLTFMADKLVYGFSLDKKTLDGVQSILDSGNVAKSEVEKLVTSLANIDKASFDKYLTWKDDGLGGRVIARNSVDDLARELPKEQVDIIRAVDNKIREGADELVKLGVLSKETRDRYIDDYLIQIYDEILLAKAQKPSVTKGGVRLDYKARQSLSKEQKEKLGIITDAKVVVGHTMMKQQEQIMRARLQNYIGKYFAIDPNDANIGKLDLSGYKKVPDAPEYKINRSIDEKKTLGILNKRLKKIISERRKVVGEHKNLLKELDDIEKRADDLHKMSAKNLSEAISGYRQLIQDAGAFKGARKKVPTSEGQKALAKSIKNWLNRGNRAERTARLAKTTKELLDEFLSTREGLALEKAFENPRMMYQWDSIDEFFDAVRFPERTIVIKGEKKGLKKLSKAEQDAALRRAERQQRELGKIKQTYTVLKDTNLKLVEDVMNKLEDEFADKLFQKKQVLETIQVNEMGNLAGKYVPNEVWDMVRGTFEPKKQFGEALVLKFKHAKVIWNPAAFPRNAISAMIQNWWVLGIGALNPKLYREAVNELKYGGETIEQMKKVGFSETTGAVYELTSNYLASKAMVDAVSQAAGVSPKTALQRLRNLDRWMTNAYGHIDNVAKVAAFKYGIKKGMSPEDAMKAAYTATYNYSQVTPFVHAMRRNLFGVPFITFNLKSVNLVSQTLAKNPGRISVFGKARNALFNAAGVEAEQEAEAMPEWMRDSAFMLRLPWKDEAGRAMYFDLTYIVPFGAIMSGEYARAPFEQNPVLQTIKELSRNETFSGRRIFNESDDMDTVIRDVFMHVSKLLLPPVVADQLPQGYDSNGYMKFKDTSPLKRFGDASQDRGANERSFTQEAFRLIGANVQPFDLESRQRQFEYRRKKALQKMLAEKGVLREFDSVYVPQGSPLKSPGNIYDREVDPLGR